MVARFLLLGFPWYFYSVAKKGLEDMSDMPIQTVLQQQDARPVPGEHLEVLGKKAAADWGMGKFASLHEAVIDTVRGERLSPEQVRRVVEFTNSNAYLNEFRKEGSHKVVTFANGPADPGQVLQDLNDGGGGTLYDRGTLDYQMPPDLGRKEASYRSPIVAGFSKTAASEEGGANLPKLTKLPSLPKLGHAQERHESAMWDLFKTSGEQMAVSDPLQPLKEVSDKLAGARDQLQHELDGLEIDYQLAGQGLFDQVKQAALSGSSLGEVVAAWSAVNTDPVYVKVAFSVLTPKLRAQGVFGSMDDIGASLSKTAALHSVVNPEHPLVGAYAEFCEALNKVAGTRALLADFAEGADEALVQLKQASLGGALGAAKKGAQAVSAGIDKVSPLIGHALVGADGAKKLAPTIARGLKGTAIAGGLLAGNAAVQSVTDRPVVRGTLSAVKSTVPGTMEYQNRRYRTQTGQ